MSRESFLKPALFHIYSSLAHLWGQENVDDNLERITIFSTTLINFFSIFLSGNCATLIEDISGLKRTSIDKSSQVPLELNLFRKAVSFLFVNLQSTTRLLPVQSHILAFGVVFGSVSNLILSTLYLLKKISVHHPLFYLLKIRLVRRDSSPDKSSGRNWQLSVILALILSIRAAEWFLNNDLTEDQLTRKLHERPLRLPPFPSRNTMSVVRKFPLSCNLCQKAAVRPCVSSSGFIFCYKCLLDHVRTTFKCPVTDHPCTEEDLILLYN